MVKLTLLINKILIILHFSLNFIIFSYHNHLHYIIFLSIYNINIIFLITIINQVKHYPLLFNILLIQLICIMDLFYLIIIK